MNSISFKRFLTNWAKFAALRILLFFGSCSLFFGLAASANTTTNNYWDFTSVQSVLNDLNSINQYTQGTVTSLQTIEGYLHGSGGVQEELNWIYNSVYRTEVHASDSKSYLSQILSKLNSWQRTQDSYLTNILYAINSKSGSGGSDILAGNPWWATNSAFTLTRYAYNLVYPDESPNSGYTFSFPQFLSRWSGLLTLPAGASAISQSSLKKNWFNYFGSLRGLEANTSYPYTWFDWMADANRSNLVLESSIVSLLEGMTNSPSLVFDDVLAGNPYWSTNSQFSPDWNLWGSQSPHPRGTPSSFPEAFSLLLSSRLRMYHPELSPSDFYNSWGIGGDNTTGADNWQVYSFEDWLADWLKSNMVLTTATSYSNLAAELAATDYTDDSLPTNTPLPNYRDLIADGDTSAAEDSITGAESILQGRIEDLSGRIGYGDAEIVLIPAMTVGGIQVREVRASLDSPITGVAHAICVFIWYVALFASLFHLASCEFAFYANLGRNWVSGGGFITSKETGEYFS